MPVGNKLDASAYRCVDAAVRNRQNQLRPSSLLWLVTTRRTADNAPQEKSFGWSGDTELSQLLIIFSKELACFLYRL
jgi:hypothetical protein